MLIKKAKFINFEDIVYKTLNVVFSAFVGFISSKTGVVNSFSPFSISLISVSPATKLSVVSMYFGIVLGYFSNGFSSLNFKYLCANTIILGFIFISGKKSYLVNLYTPVFPGIVCFSVGLLFLFIENFSLYELLILICESVLCSCASFFILYFCKSIEKKNKMDSKDLISLNIALILVICALDSFYFYGFSVSAVFLQIIIFLSAYYFDGKFSALFLLSLCFVVSILHAENINYFLYFYLPALFSILVSKLEKKYIVVTYFVAQATVITIFGISYLSLNIIVTPLISGFIYGLLPKKKLEELFSKYIDVSTEREKINSNTELCMRYCSNADKISDIVTNFKIEPALNNDKATKLKKYLRKYGCDSIEISNFQSADGKHYVTMTCETDKEIDISSVIERLYRITNSTFRIIEKNYEKNIYYVKLEQSNNYRIECFASYKTKSGEKICGDNACAFKSSGNDYYIMLADGMGSGKNAYSKSYDTISLMKKLLKIGVDPIAAIKTVNSSLFMIKDEIGFSTIDLFAVSLETGAADFYKCGAYATFIIRGKTIIKIKESGLPVGLENKITPEKQTIYLQDGDLILMMSDGIASSEREVLNYILKKQSSSYELLTKEIIDIAAYNTPVCLEDDMTVILSNFSSCRNN